MEAAAKTLTQQNITDRLDQLPTLPSIVYELSRVINDPMSSTTDIERIMSNDASLTAKVLSLANSAYYAIPGGVTSLSRAVAYIGFDTINQLVLSASIFDALSVKGPQKFDLNEFWKHSIGVAITTETIAKRIHHPMPSDLFTCGLVHDMGKIALYTIEPDLMLQIVELAKHKQISYSEAESELEVIKHTKIGQLLAKKWNLPMGLQATICHHHTRELAARGTLTSDLQRNVDLVYLGNLLTHALKFGNSGHSKILGAPTDVLERIGLIPEKDLKPLLIEIKGSLSKANDFLRVLAGGQA